MNRKTQITGLVIAVIMTMLAVPIQAQTTGVTLSFYNITANDPDSAAIGEAQLFVDVTEGSGGQVLFTFRNTGPELSSICDVYFDDGNVQVLASIAAIDDSDPGVSFSVGATPPNLPGGNPFGFSADFAADSDNPVQPNGVNPGESLGITFNLQTGRTFQDLLDELENGDLRIGIHVQGFANGQSEGFINDPPGEEPELGTIIIVKSADPADGTDFGFSSPELGEFTLDHAIPDDGDDFFNSRIWTDMDLGTYVVTEAVSDEWELDHILCSDPDEGTSVSISDATATIDLDAGEVVVCTFVNIESTAITLASFTAQASVSSVGLAWETGTEIDNAGFNLYRATAPDGPYTKVNDTLIAAEGDPVAGASYTFLDKGIAEGNYYYKLEDVDYYGVTKLHGPVSVTVLPRLRRPAYRPTAP